MSRKLFVMFLGVSLLALNEVKAAYYECYLPTDLKKQKPLGQNPIRGLGNAGSSVCEAEYQACNPPTKCTAQQVSQPQRSKLF